MSDESDHDKIIRLEERQEASETALKLALDTVKLATNSMQVLMAQALSILAIVVSVWAIFHK